MSNARQQIVRTSSAFINLMFATCVLILVYLGWSSREKLYITAEEGLGYGLGITGGVMMLVLLLYPVRKNFKFMRNFLPVRYWFRMHMMLGVLGPLLIVFHSGFYLGSTNSTVALFSMLIVAFSGLFGRYFYSKIHYGLYGRRKTLDEVLKETEQGQSELKDVLEFNSDLAPELEKLNQLISGARQSVRSVSLLNSLLYSRKVTIATRKFERKAKKSLNKKFSLERSNSTMPTSELKTMKKRFIKSIGLYAKSAQKQAEFVVFEKLFSLWHVLHVPLFLLLIITGFFHVYAVHVY